MRGGKGSFPVAWEVFVFALIFLAHALFSRKSSSHIAFGATTATLVKLEIAYHLSVGAVLAFLQPTSIPYGFALCYSATATRSLACISNEKHTGGGWWCKFHVVRFLCHFCPRVDLFSCYT